VIDKVWHDLHPDQELRQEPGRPSNAAVMGFFRAKQVATGGLAGPNDSAGLDEDLDDHLSLPGLGGSQHHQGDFDINPPSPPVPPISLPSQTGAVSDPPSKEIV
jgi:hypothetical protein